MALANTIKKLNARRLNERPLSVKTHPSVSFILHGEPVVAVARTPKEWKDFRWLLKKFHKDALVVLHREETDLRLKRQWSKHHLDGGKSVEKLALEDLKAKGIDLWAGSVTFYHGITINTGRVCNLKPLV